MTWCIEYLMETVSSYPATMSKEDDKVVGQYFNAPIPSEDVPVIRRLLTIWATDEEANGSDLRANRLVQVINFLAEVPENFTYGDLTTLLMGACYEAEELHNEQE